MNRKLSRTIQNFGAYSGAVGALVFFLFPVLYMVTAAFKTSTDFGRGSSAFFVFDVTLDHFENLFTELGAGSATLNSLVIVAISTFSALILGTLASFAFTHYSIRGKSALLLEILSIRMFPPIVSAIPFFLLSQELGIHDTHLILILVYTLIGLPLVVWVMNAFMGEVPRSVEEAALIDGCTHLQVLYRITLPLLLPGIAATVMVVVLFAWNEYLFASLLTSSTAKTLPVIAAQALKPKAIAWGLASAAGVFMSLPVVALALILQRYLVRGLTFGALKG